MKIYFAPMEGLTGYIYRNAHNAFFPGVDKYFSPFIVANQNDRFKTKEFNDLLPENNQGIFLIPQILTNQSKDFINTANKIKQLGYHEINLNLGCPSGTVVSKGRGAGFLAKTKELDIFLDDIFSQSTVKISVKTRIGIEQPEEFYSLIQIFNKYPMEELIIHPRTQKDFYKNKPDLQIFEEALQVSKNRVCYNGDIFTRESAVEFTTKHPNVDKIMMGRGLITNPGLVTQIKENKKLEQTILKEFHDRIYTGYQSILFGDRNVLFKMKELWFYMISDFPDSARYAKKIKKSERLCDYEEAVSSLFRECKINIE